jgi:choline dehydrogenase-like flavoprotein
MRFRGLRGEKQDPFYPADIKNTIRYQTEEQISVDRIRVVGGRTVHWNAVVLRYSRADFRERSLNGIEEDWPLSYDELAPFYDRVERMIGVCGNDDGLEQLPAGPWYLPPLALRCSEQILKRAVEPLGIPVISVRKALLTRPYDNRPPCHYCGHCMDGCDVSAIFSTPSSMLPKAVKTGNFTLRPNAVAREILVNEDGLARGVSIVDRTTKQEEEISARIVVVCCATVETARLLLNSRSTRYPAGLANSSDAVGRYLNGHLGDIIHIYLKELEGRPPENQDGALDHAFVPRYKTKSPTGAFDFQVNYGGYMFPYQAKYLPGFGHALKQRVRQMEPGFLLLGGYGKVAARPENRVTVDPNRLDAYGIPTPVVKFKFGELDHAIWAEMRDTVAAMCDRLKGDVTKPLGDRPSGFASHEVGTVRMGKDPKTSVLNSYCQAHDVKNLFVTDGSTFTTSSEKNPTLTIMALSLRAADYIKEQRRRGDL